jgi:GMP synthase-like glutamine amidotransferase
MFIMAETTRSLMNRKKIRVAIVDNSLNPSLYDPVSHWEAHLDVPWKAFRACEHKLPSLDEGFTHLILTGSEASILQRDAWVGEEVELVKEAVDRELSVLGSCYGHQLLALALRSSSQVRRCPDPEVGWIPLRVHEENVLLGDRGVAFSFSVHFDEVVNLDDGFRVLASTEECPVQAFELKDKPVWGIQIHPEIDIAQGRELLRRLAALNLPSRLLYEKALRQSPRDSGLIREVVRNFLQGGFRQK